MNQRHAALLALVLGVLGLGRALVPGRALLPMDPRLYAPLDAGLDGETSRALLEEAVPHRRDKLQQFLPYDTLVARSWRQGRAPTWSQDLFCGMPLLAQATSRPFYPTALAFLLADPAALYAWTWLLHLVLGGVFAWRLARFLGASPQGALIADASFVLSGWTVAHVHHPMIFMAGLWALPAMEAAGRILRGPPAVRPVLALAATVGLSWLAGFSQGSVLVVYMAGGMALALGIERMRAERRVPWSRLALVAAGVGLGLLWAAPQILPTAALLPETSRAPATTAALRDSALPLVGLCELLLPGQLAAPGDVLVYGGPRPTFLSLLLFPTAKMPLLAGNAYNHTETAFAVGIWPLMLALSILPRVFRRGTKDRAAQTFLWILTAVGIGGAMALPGLLGLLELVPGVAVGRMPRLLLLPAVALPVLAGLAWRPLPRFLRRDVVFVAVPVLCLAGLILFASDAGFARGFGDLLAQRFGQPSYAERFVAALGPGEAAANRGLLGFGLLRLGLVLALVPALAFRGQALLGVLLALVLELVPIAWATTPAPLLRSLDVRLPGLPAELPDSPRPRLLRVEQDLRQASASHLLPANLGVRQGLADCTGYGPLPLARSEAFFEALEPGSTSGGAGLSALRRTDSLASPLIALLAPRYLLLAGSPAPSGWRPLEVTGDAGLYESEATPVRVRLYYDHEVLARDAVPARLGSADFDPMRTVLLEQAPDPVPGRPDAEALVETLAWDDGRLRFRVESASPVLLLVSEAWAPGWVARFDGLEVPTKPAQLMFQAVSLPAGAREVTLVYVADRFGTGLALAVVGLLLVPLGLLLSGLSSRPRR